MDSNSLLVTMVLLGTTLCLVFNDARKRSVGGVSLPPGPQPLPILGNIFDLTSKELWLRVHQWGAQYGMDLPFRNLLS